MEYQEKNLSYMDDEEKSLHLLHRNYKSYGVGHGCSASWELKNNKCIKVFSEIFPVIFKNSTLLSSVSWGRGSLIKLPSIIGFIPKSI